MNLVIDIGNTVVKAGLFRDAELVRRGEFATLPRREADEWGVLLVSWLGAVADGRRIQRVLIGSVAQSALIPLRAAVRAYLGVTPLEVEQLKVRLPILLEDPSQIGADRIANAVGAAHRYPLPAIVVDCGTATTYDVIAADGSFMGGAIAPGIRPSMATLWRQTERLFPVELHPPARAIGRTTVEALTAGIFHSFVGSVREMVRVIALELAQRPTVIATGGVASLLAEECDTVDHVDLDLTLVGLNLLVEEFGGTDGGSDT